MAGLVLISPAIGVSPVAALAVWQARLRVLLGLDKLAWNSILPEYDPYQYKSFAVNAGDLVHRLTGHIQVGLRRLARAGRLEAFPPVLALVSVVDATVSVPALVDGPLRLLPPGVHELVLFALSHVALPFPPDDPLYGEYPARTGSGLHLGDIALRGERGVLRISASERLRLRWNPFFPYL